MASENRPGVTVTQALTETVAVSATPTLIPLVVAPCFQIIESLKSDGSLNADAKHSAQYNQASLTITEANFPDPRGNIDEVDIDSKKVEASLTTTSGLNDLKRGSHGSTGVAFLKRIDSIYRPAIKFNLGAGFINFSSTVKTLVMGIDSVNSASDQGFLTYSFVGTMTVDEIVAEFNDTAGKTIAFKEGTTGVVVFSSTYGPAGSITIRGDSSAFAYLDPNTEFIENDNTTSLSAASNGKDVRIEGSGLYVQDDEDGDQTGMYISYSRGVAKYSSVVKGTSFTSLSSWPVWAGYNVGEGDANTWSSTQASAVTFGGSSPTIPLKKATTTTPGDYLVADGSWLRGSEVILVEETRFKLGTINSSKSTYVSGELTTRIYDTLELNVLTNSAPFSPQYAYFVAQNLVYGSVSPEGEAAVLVGSADNIIDHRKAQVSGILDSTLQGSGTVAAGGLTLIITETVDGVQKPAVTVAFSGANQTAADLASQVNGFEDSTAEYTLTCSADIVGDYFVISSGKEGADQSISVGYGSTGSANNLLGFSTSANTSASGKDFECASAASFETQPFDFTHNDAKDALIHVTFTDSSGADHTVNASLSASANFTSLSDVVTEISSTFDGTGGLIMKDGIAVGKVEAVGGDKLKFSTVEGGSASGIVVGSSSPALGIFESDLKSTVLSFADVAALTDLQLEESGTPITAALTFSGPTIAAVVAALNADTVFNAADDADFFAFENSAGTITILHMNSSKVGNIATTSIAGTTALIGNATAFADIDEAGEDRLKGSSLVFMLDDNPYKYEISSFLSNSVQSAVDSINELVGGDSDIATFSSSTGAVSITSSNVGVSSKVEIKSTGTAQGSTILDFSTLKDEGAGRPNPNFYVDGNGSIILGANILRSSTTGIPFDTSSAFSDIYIGYTGLRKDVSSSASSPAILSFGNISDLIASIGPISVDNPLGLAAYLCMLNSAGSSISCLGLDETSAASPKGTVNSYLRALEFLESKEVYAVAPMTDDLFIQRQIATHVQTMSQPSERGERIALFWSKTPTRGVDTNLSVTNSTATPTGTNNELTLGSNHSSDVSANGITDQTSISVDKGLYLEVSVVSSGSTTVSNYSVSKLTGAVASLRTSFSSGENDDGFYSAIAFDGSTSLSRTITYAIRIRGSKLLIKGTNLKDIAAITQAAAAEASAFNHRRIFHLFGDSADISLDGIKTNIPGYYISAGIAGMISSQLPQQPFTNVIMNGFSKVYGTDDTYSENQLDVIADGGRYVVKNLGGGIAARHQRSTSNTTIESRELSITKAIDFLAKGLRSVNRAFIGRFVITPGFLDQLTMANEGYLRSVVQTGVVQSSSLKSLLQSESAPDTVLIEVEVQPAYPCNKIRITIVS